MILTSTEDVNPFDVDSVLKTDHSLKNLLLFWIRSIAIIDKKYYFDVNKLVDIKLTLTFLNERIPNEYLMSVVRMMEWWQCARVVYVV